MDFSVQWKVSSNVEKLVDAVQECKQGLTTATFGKYGRAKLLSCDVYASAKIVEFLRLSTLWSPLTEFSEDGERVKSYDIASHVVADFNVFRLFQHKVFGDDVIRMVCTYDVCDGVDKVMYGNIHLV